jgi:hypothetical protein
MCMKSDSTPHCICMMEKRQVKFSHACCCSPLLSNPAQLQLTGVVSGGQRRAAKAGSGCNKMINNWRQITAKVSLATEIINNRRQRRQTTTKVSLTTHNCPSTDGSRHQRVMMVGGNSNGSGLTDKDKQPQRVAANGKVSSHILL